VDTPLSLRGVHDAERKAATVPTGVPGKDGRARAQRASPESLEKEFGVTASTILSWVKQEDLDRGARADGLTSDEKAELARLRRENKRLQEERDIPRKFAAWSAQEMNSTPPKRSGS
jgi:transposase